MGSRLLFLMASSSSNLALDINILFTNKKTKKRILSGDYKGLHFNSPKFQQKHSLQKVFNRLHLFKNPFWLIKAKFKCFHISLEV